MGAPPEIERIHRASESLQRCFLCERDVSDIVTFGYLITIAEYLDRQPTENGRLEFRLCLTCLLTVLPEQIRDHFYQTIYKDRS